MTREEAARLLDWMAELSPNDEIALVQEEIDAIKMAVTALRNCPENCSECGTKLEVDDD